MIPKEEGCNQRGRLKTEPKVSERSHECQERSHRATRTASSWNALREQLVKNTSRYIKSEKKQ